MWEKSTTFCDWCSLKEKRYLLWLVCCEEKAMPFGANMGETLSLRAGMGGALPLEADMRGTLSLEAGIGIGEKRSVFFYI